jgi:hypothetical protein
MAARHPQSFHENRTRGIPQRVASNFRAGIYLRREIPPGWAKTDDWRPMEPEDMEY